MQESSSPRNEILVVDTKPELPAVLARAGAVRHVRNAPAAQKLLKQERGWLGLLTPEHVGDASGFDLVALAREQHPGMPALVVLDQPDPRALHQAFALGADVLCGPLSNAQLKEFARRARSSPQRLHPALSAQIDALARDKELLSTEVDMVVGTILGRSRDELAREAGVPNNTLKSRIRALLRKCGSPDLASLALALCRAAAFGPASPLPGANAAPVASAKPAKASKARAR